MLFHAYSLEHLAWQLDEPVSLDHFESFEFTPLSRRWLRKYALVVSLINIAAAVFVFSLDRLHPAFTVATVCAWPGLMALVYMTWKRGGLAIVGDGGFTMTPHVLCTAVEYNIPVVWVIWNNFAWGAIRDIQYGLFNGREHGTGFYQGELAYNPDFAMLARAHGVEAVTITQGEDFREALEYAVKLNKPYVLDVHVDPNIRPPATGTWALPPTPYKEPVFGERYLPGMPD